MLNTRLDKGNCLAVISKASPVLRYRTIIEILGEEGKKVDGLRSNLMNCENVQQWLRLLKPRYDRNIHGSTSEAFENVMGKLYDFGLRKGVKGLDSRVEPYLEIMDGTKSLDIRKYMDRLYYSMIAGFLAMTGYEEHKGIIEVLTDRLDRIYDYVKNNDLSDFYVGRDGFKGVPKAFRSKKLVNPLYYDGRGLALPTIYDLLGFLHSNTIMSDPADMGKVEEVLRLIFSCEYQSLPVGYGYVWEPPRRYYAMGWSIHLPLFNTEEVTGRDFSLLLLYMGLLKKSRYVRNHKWYDNAISFLSRFIGGDGVPLFPSDALPEKKAGYWVFGSRMGLEPGRRTRKVLLNESAFRMLSYST